MLTEVDRLTEWILENRRGDAFKGFSEELIRETLEKANAEDCLFYTCDTDGKIKGVLVARHIIHISHVLTVKPKAIHQLVSILLKVYRDSCIIQAFRKGSVKIYKRATLLRKLYG
jgi:hypothetical protein